MIKKQYRRSERGYFHNFILSLEGGAIEEKLKEYNATLGKSKNTYYMINVKWHNKESYLMFRLTYS